MKDVEDALLDFADIFDELGIPYAIMDGLAVRAYGVPRPTYDVDVTIAISDDKLNELYGRIEERGYTVPDSYRSGWVDRTAGMPLVKFRIYRPDKSVDVDVFIVETAFQHAIMKRRCRWIMDDLCRRFDSSQTNCRSPSRHGRHRRCSFYVRRDGQALSEKMGGRIRDRVRA